MKYVLFVSVVFLSALVNAANFDWNVPGPIRKQVTQDLAFVGSMKGTATSPLHQQIFGAMDGANYLNFFNSRVKTVSLGLCGFAKSAVACVNPVIEPSKIHLTANYLLTGLPQIARMMVVFHEARHSENTHDHWPHAKCPTPFNAKGVFTGPGLAGLAACDNSPYGSYGSSAIMMKNISKYCSNCTDKVKTDAGIFADDQALRIIDPASFAAMTKDFN